MRERAMSTQRPQRAGESAEDAGEAAASAESGLLASAAPSELSTAAGAPHSLFEGCTTAYLQNAQQREQMIIAVCLVPVKLHVTTNTSGMQQVSCISACSYT